MEYISQSQERVDIRTRSLLHDGDNYTGIEKHLGEQRAMRVGDSGRSSKVSFVSDVASNGNKDCSLSDGLVHM